MKKIFLSSLFLMALAPGTMTAQLASRSAYRNAYEKAVANTSNVGTHNSVEIKTFKKLNKALLKDLETKYKGYDVEVKQTSHGMFIITVTKKIKNQVVEMFLVNDSGKLLYYEPVDSWSEFNNDKSVIAISKNGKYGVVDFKGEQILPIAYDAVTCILACDEWKEGDNTCWHASTNKTFITVDEKDRKVSFHDTEGAVYKTVNGIMSAVSDYYLSIGFDNKKGLFDLNGKQLVPSEYASFEVMGTSGFVKTIVIENETKLRRIGGRNLRPEMAKVVVPNKFFDVKWDNDSQHFSVALHRESPWLTFHPDSTYVIDYKDNGIKYWDAENFEKVIEFYEGEGYGQPWGYYYMGMAAKAIADKEYNKIQRANKVLKDENTYYYPIVAPDSYKFNYSKAVEMYIDAASYLEKYIKEENVPDNDPTKVQARKLRGAMVSKEHEVRDMYDDYSRLYSAASAKYAEYKANLQIQQARQAAQEAQLQRNISNIVGKILR